VLYKSFLVSVLRTAPSSGHGRRNPFEIAFAAFVPRRGHETCGHEMPWIRALSRVIVGMVVKSDRD
jgi:hypothetical protein